MTIDLNDFTITDNGDGTFALTPIAPLLQAELRDAYRASRDKVKRLVAYKQKLQGKISDTSDELAAQRADRDAWKVLLLAAGDTPDSDQEEATP